MGRSWGWRRRTAEDRAVEQWRAELDRHLDSGEDPWRAFEAGPQQHRLEGGLPETGPWPEPGTPRRRRRARGPLLPGLAVVVGLLAFVGLSNPGSASYWAQELARRATGGDSASYAFMDTPTVSGQPTAWDHCQPIRYVVNPAGAPPGWEDLVDDAVAEVNGAGEFDLVDAGTTEDRDHLGRRPGQPVLLGWGSPAEWSQLRGDVAGFGGATSLGVDGRIRFVTGQVLLDADDYDRMDRTGQGEAMRQILVHELLHVMGLDHVDDRGELMYPTYRGQSLGPGDRAGLARLAQVPCA